MNKACINCKFYNLNRCLKFPKKKVTGETTHLFAKKVRHICDLKLYEPILPEYEKKMEELKKDKESIINIGKWSFIFANLSAINLMVIKPESIVGYIFFAIQVPALTASSLMLVVSDDMVTDNKKEIKELESKIEKINQ